MTEVTEFLGFCKQEMADRAIWPQTCQPSTKNDSETVSEVRGTVVGILILDFRFLDPRTDFKISVALNSSVIICYIIPMKLIQSFSSF